MRRLAHLDLYRLDKPTCSDGNCTPNADHPNRPRKIVDTSRVNTESTHAKPGTVWASPAPAPRPSAAPPAPPAPAAITRSTMLRVAHVIQSADVHAGGTTTAFLGLLDALATRPDVAPTAYFVRPPDGDPIWERIRRSPNQYRTAPTRAKFLWPAALGRIAAADILAGKFDVLHIHGLWGADLACVARAARRAGIPALWQSHGMMLRWAMNYKRLKKRIYLNLGLQRVLNQAGGFICMTRDEVTDSVFPPNSPVERRFLVPLPVTLPAVPPDRAALRAAGRDRFAIPADAITFAFLGRLHPVKRVEMTIEAFASACSNPGHPASLPASARLLILGKGEDDYEKLLRDRAAALGVTDRVIFAGWVGGDTKLQGLAAADALVVNSSIESFGYVLFEAIGVGTPVIITDNISLATEFHDAGAGMRAANSVDSLADAMRRFASLPRDERDAMAQRGVHWTAHTFSRESIGELLERTYRAVLPAPRPS